MKCSFWNCFCLHYYFGNLMSSGNQSVINQFFVSVNFYGDHDTDKVEVYLDSLMVYLLGVSGHVQCLWIAANLQLWCLSNYSVFSYVIMPWCDSDLNFIARFSFESVNGCLWLHWPNTVCFVDM